MEVHLSEMFFANLMGVVLQPWGTAFPPVSWGKFVEIFRIFYFRATRRSSRSLHTTCNNLSLHTTIKKRFYKNVSIVQVEKCEQEDYIRNIIHIIAEWGRVGSESGPKKIENPSRQPIKGDVIYIIKSRINDEKKEVISKGNWPSALYQCLSMRQIQNEFMAHAVANEWRSQKEVILLSQVFRITLLYFEDENVWCAKTAGRSALKM